MLFGRRLVLRLGALQATVIGAEFICII